MSKIDHSLFNADEHALHHAYGECPECAANLQIRSGRSGLFLGCSRYPDCHFSKPLHEQQHYQLKVIEGSACPECGSELAVKKGRYGLFIGCTHFPECHHIEKLDDSEPQEDSPVDCPSCAKGKLHQKTNRYGKHFYACDQYPECRYILNHSPVERACPECGWPIMVERQLNGEQVWQCPQKQCQAKVIADG
ncbi:uncharacterized protein HMF8227_00027 [Saliniradius amylolyticus]|uniref:DNA topoisomerase type IA zn finger domain-containing protein n=1 Tax=Saliniradius amylolyticus TaxID=2183582 RepID=A0A2S2DZU5_9ALTE|nr:topoisomerase DNA-binding C4 zinc finger domain-containing protein [Saliniradius amylolyticus]AWL10540.1 uncharacterized protein HMF8227_00027 [Saliniradius amylolyticus]